MPTGYTSWIEEKDISFKEFAYLCAHNFGALVDLRDEHLSATLPEKFNPSDYHIKNLESEKAKLAKMQELSPAEAQDRSFGEYSASMDRIEKYMRNQCELEIRYKKILAEVKAWTPPTPDHQGLKDFMIDQIRISSPRDNADFPEFPMKLDGEQWRAKQIDKIIDSIAYHETEYQKECERVLDRNLWIKNLRDSLEQA